MTIDNSGIFFDHYDRKAQQPELTHFCPGCGHGNLHKWIAEAVLEEGLKDRCVWISPVGCGGLTHQYINVGHILAAHGRASAVGTAVKRLSPESIVVVYQGDGDFAAIGLAESIHAANRGESLSVFFVNNAVYAMTGGQMAPTTLLGQKTVTSPEGRSAQTAGEPLHMCEMLTPLNGVCFAARVAIGNPTQLLQARSVIRRAIQNQKAHRGYSFVEILSPCPTNWHMSPVMARQWVSNEMTKIFPLGVFKDTTPEPVSINVDNTESFEDFINLFEVPPLFSTIEARQQFLSSLPTLSFQFAGFGGQGVLRMGLFLARLITAAGGCVSWLPSYGPEMRGGTCHCHVQLSAQPIVSPIVEQMDCFVAMNAPSLAEFASHVREGGYIFFDGDEFPENFIQSAVYSTLLSRKIHLEAIPATRLGMEMGEGRHSNFIMVGAALKRTLNCEKTDIVSFLRLESKENEHAFLTGWEWNN